MTALSRLPPGVGAGREQTDPYAAAWRRANHPDDARYAAMAHVVDLAQGLEVAS